MDSLGQLNAEFETLGEAAVAERLNANVYKDEARALAMRWLNERSLARKGVGEVRSAPVEHETRRLFRAEQGVRIAILCATAALLAAIGALGLSWQTLRAVQALSHVAASATAPQPPAARP